MARRGTFGRMPRAVPSLTNTLVAIAREQENQRDQNIMDAWKNGGLFEGKKATDEMVLAHWRARLAEVSVDDPQYDVFNNAVLQLEYSIAESKKSTDYANGKISTVEMANFYLSWSKKVPKNSEFWRVLQRDAGNLMQRAKSESAATTAKAKEQSYQNSVTSLKDKYYKTADYAMDVVRNALIVLGNVNGINSDITDFQAMDPGKTQALFDLINAGGDTPLYYDPEKKKNLTAGDFLAKLKELDPTFSGTLTTGQLVTWMDNKITGTNKVANLAKTTGHASDYNSAVKDRGYTAEILRETNAWPVSTEYMQYNKDWTSVRDDVNATMQEKSQAWDTYVKQLTDLAGSPALAEDPYTANRLKNEINGVVGGPALSEDFTGIGTFSGDENGAGGTAIERNNAILESIKGQLESVASGEAIWVTGTWDSKNQFTPGAGTGVGAIPREMESQLSTYGTTVVAIPDGRNNGQVMEVVVPLQAVYVDSTDSRDPTGKTLLMPTSKTPVAYTATVMVGGEETRMYAVMGAGPDGKQQLRWLKPGVSPFSETGLKGVSTAEDGSLHVRYAGPEITGDQIGQGAGYSVTVSSTGVKTLVFDPLVVAIDPSFNATNASDSELTSASPTLALIMGTQDNPDVFGQYRDNVDVETRIWEDAVSASGSATNPDGTVTRGDPDYRNQVIWQLDGVMGKRTGISTMIPAQTSADVKGGSAPVYFMSDGSKSSGFFSGTTAQIASNPLGATWQSAYASTQAMANGSAPNPARSLIGTAFAGLGTAWDPKSSYLSENGKTVTDKQYSITVPMMVNTDLTNSLATPQNPEWKPTVVGSTTYGATNSAQNTNVPYNTNANSTDYASRFYKNRNKV